MPDLHETRHRRVTYCSAPAETWELARSRNAATRAGERVTALRWIDDGVHGRYDEDGDTVEVSHRAGDLELGHIRGDGRTADFERYDRVIIPGGTDAHAYAYAEGRLTAADARVGVSGCAECGAPLPGHSLIVRPGVGAAAFDVDVFHDGRPVDEAERLVACPACGRENDVVDEATLADEGAVDGR